MNSKVFVILLMLCTSIHALDFEALEKSSPQNTSVGVDFGDANDAGEKKHYEIQKKQKKTIRKFMSKVSDGGNRDGDIGLCMPSIPLKCCKSYECKAKTASSRYENATVKLTKDYVGNCYTLDVYGGNGFGSGSTCSGPNDNWAVTANGASGSVNGLSAAIAWILHRL